MNKRVPTQHPAVVLRSQHRQLQFVLAIAVVAIIGLSVAVGILANDHAPGTRSAPTGSGPSEPGGGPARGPDGVAGGSPSPPVGKKGRTVPR
jgi:hypothetical protein